MIKKQKRTNLVMFTNSKGNVTVEVRLIDDTVWLTQQQIAELFEKDRSVITRHINNVFKSSELGKEVCAKFAHTANDGKTYQSNFYNLDMIISVGYRINSKRGIEFRRWANNLIKNHLIKGYTVNKSRIKKTQLEELNRTIELISDTLVNQNLLDDKSSELLYMIKSYSKTWSILIEYDENKLEIPNYKDNRDINRINYEEAKKAINLLKVKLVSEKQAGELFGLEKNKSLHGILNNIYQTFDKKDLYSSLEEEVRPKVWTNISQF